MSKREDPLSSWLALNAALKTMKEKQLQDLLKKEQMNNARPSFLVRIYGRFNRVRGQRELKELLK